MCAGMTRIKPGGVRRAYARGMYRYVTAWILLAFAAAMPPAAASECATAVQHNAPAHAIATPGLRIGVALSSGSMHGLAHVGVIEALEEAGVDVRVVSGTSVGALVGSLWASGMSGRAIERLAESYDWDSVGGFSRSWDGLMSNARMRSQLEPLFGGRPIESWPRRFGAVATNLANGQRRILMTGDAALAVQASTAVPVLFTPVSVGGERLGDGALVEPVPVEAARALGADFVIAVDVNYRPYEEAASGLTGNAFQAMHILMNGLAARQRRDANFALRLDLHHDFIECGREALIAAGRAAMRRAMPQLAAAIAREAARRAVPGHALDLSQTSASARR